jgi:hypothetical protein
VNIGRTTHERLLAELDRGGSFDEIAVRLGTTRNAVRCMAARVRQRQAAGLPPEGRRVAAELEQEAPPAYRKLRAWIDAQGLTVVQFADYLGLSVQAMRLWRRGVCVPSLALAVRIEAATGVMPREWCPDDFARARGEAAA